MGLDGFEIRHALDEDSVPFLVLRNSKSPLTTFLVGFVNELGLLWTLKLLGGGAACFT
jgi:hypothetical protein